MKNKQLSICMAKSWLKDGQNILKIENIDWFFLKNRDSEPDFVSLLLNLWC